MRLFDAGGLPALDRLMKLGAWKQRVHANNVANLNTPGYERLAVRFGEHLQQAAGGPLDLAVTSAQHAGGPEAALAPIEVVPAAAAGEESVVDLDREMVALAEAQMSFSLAARLTSLRIAGIRAAIQGRR